MKAKIRLQYHIILLSMFVVLGSCSKLVEVDPPIINTNGDNVFNDNSTAVAVLTGIYTNMSNAQVNTEVGWLTNVCFLTGLTGDELSLVNKSDGTFAPYYSNNISPTANTWLNFYNIIFIANSAIEGLSKSSNLTLDVKNQLLGEAKFIRAFTFFYLVNLYGDVPMPLTTDYQLNRTLPRSPTNDVYNQIEEDLKAAKQLLADHFVAADCISQTTERVRPIKWAASALLARVYLYRSKFVEAEAESDSLISRSDLFNIVDLDQCFLKNNNEAIWQLQPVGTADLKTANTPEGTVFNISIAGDINFYSVYLTNSVVSSFDNRDLRRSHWIDSITSNGMIYYFPYKYKVGQENVETKEYSTVLRLSEQYLIRAEARIQQGKITEGLDDLNIIRKRATDMSAPETQQLPQLPTSNVSSDVAMQLVDRERYNELFTEWGHRWFDMKRRGTITKILSVVKSGWQDTDQLFPLPKAEVGSDPNLIGHQNPGYN
jgi:starch-binding outer membrane protein, SusD/RagB family